ncbi:MAG TPA: thioredoxin fold domain-containing protein [Burkholderiaceae bacterium]|nr:thioredoxin fold domain-containing protein [Burkholderiaceae bacterium]
MTGLRGPWMCGAAFALALVLAGGAVAAPLTLPVPTSLPEAARAAAASGQPLVLLVSLPGCPYCESVRRSYLMPLQRERGAVVAEIDMDADRPLVGFDGRGTTQAAAARGWRVRVAPTVLFLDPQGRELAPRLEGIAVPDFYGAYLEERWVRSRAVLRRSAPAGR